MKKAKILLITAAALGVMTGCSKFEPKETAILAKKNGNITSVVIETLDQSYYDASELQELIDTSVAQYNAAAGGENITVKDFTAAQQTATLTMEYQSGSDYAAFNNVTCYSGDLLGAYNAGYDFQTTFQQVEKGTVTNAAVTREEVLNSYNYYTLILEEPVEVQVEGKLVYVSGNVEVTGKNTCRAAVSGLEAVQEETQPATMEDGTVLLSPTSVSRESGGGTALAYIMYE